MARRYWLVKQEPRSYSFARLQEDGRTMWEGVRNHQARRHLMEMRKGDRVLFYHSVVGKEVVGICEVAREHYPDPTAGDPRWVAVDLAAVRPLRRPVSLDAIRRDPALAEIALLRQSRLSVMPLTKPAFDRIVRLGS